MDTPSQIAQFLVHCQRHNQHAKQTGEEAIHTYSVKKAKDFANWLQYQDIGHRTIDQLYTDYEKSI